MFGYKELQIGSRKDFMRTAMMDVETEEVFIFNYVNKDELFDFQDSYEQPYNLIKVKLVYVDGAGTNGRYSRICNVTDNGIYRIKIIKSMTNNEAEYEALLYYLNRLDRPYTHSKESLTVIVTDSQLIHRQLTGEYKVKSLKLLNINKKVKELLILNNVKVIWRPREKNLAGIMLETR